jgi:hypothetical protein
MRVTAPQITENTNSAMSRKEGREMNNDKPSRSARRIHKPANKVAPLVREMAEVEFAEQHDSERIARRFGLGRLDVTDVVLGEAVDRIRAIERRLGLKLRDGFGRRVFAFGDSQSHGVAA